jgi:hypothetical protein
MDMSALSEEVMDFLERHAKTAGDYDPEFDAPGDRFNGPDSALLYGAAVLMAQGLRPIRVHSTWTSGCYKGWQDETLQAQHDDLVRRVNELAL